MKYNFKDPQIVETTLKVFKLIGNHETYLRNEAGKFNYRF